MSSLDERWLALWPHPEQRAAAAALLADIQAHYRANDRFYHTLTHIERMLARVDELAPYAEDMRAVRLAVWFHDAIYDFQAKDNEAQSAAYARQALATMGEPAARIEQVAALIEATRHRQTTDVDGDTAVVRDADLATLAAPWAEYERYARQIRQEYQDLTDEVYRNGRLQMLQEFIQRDPLFFTPVMAPLTEKARQNLRRECDLLLTTADS